MLVVQSDAYNRSGLATVVLAVITSNTRLAVMPGNVALPALESGLPHDSVVNVTGLLTVDESELGEIAGSVVDSVMRQVDEGLRGVLDL